MNRIVLCGVALFFAIVGIALLGGEEKANAGLFGGSSCDGSDCSGSCGGKKLFSGHHKKCSGGGLFAGHCSGREKCHGRDRCHGGGLFKKHRCNGSDCSGGASDCSGGEVKELKDAPAPAPADATPPAPPAPEKKA